VYYYEDYYDKEFDDDYYGEDKGHWGWHLSWITIKYNDEPLCDQDPEALFEGEPGVENECNIDKWTAYEATPPYYDSMIFNNTKASVKKADGTGKFTITAEYDNSYPPYTEAKEKGDPTDFNNAIFNDMNKADYDFDFKVTITPNRGLPDYRTKVKDMMNPETIIVQNCAFVEP